MSNATTVQANVRAVSALLASVDSWHSIDFWASVFCFVGGIVSAAGGVGGGGLYVPVLILLGGLSSQAAVPVSTVIIFGNAFASLAFNAETRHPTADRPLIDLQVVLLLEPPTLTGAALGVLLNRVLPASVTFVLLVLILGLTTVRTTMRGCRLLKQRKADAHLERAWSRVAVGRVNDDHRLFGHWCFNRRSRGRCDLLGLTHAAAAGARPRPHPHRRRSRRIGDALCQS